MPVDFDWPSDEGYARFVTEHAQTLARLALLVTGNRYDAEDAVQDAVISVAARWTKLTQALADWVDTQPDGFIVLRPWLQPVP